MKSVSFTRRLFSHTLNFGLGSVLPKVIGFLLIPLYTIYLSPDDFGIIELATSFSGFLIVFMRLGVPGSVSRFYYDYEDPAKLRDYITTIFWFLIICSAVLGGLTWVIGHFFFESLMPGLPFYPFGLLVIFAAFFNSNSDLQRRLIQVREQSGYSAKLSTATALVTIVFSVLLVVGFKMGALGIVLALLISAIVFFVQAQVYLRDDLRGSIQLQLLRPSFVYAMGVLPAHLVNNFAPLLNKVLLSDAVSLSAVGILGVAIRFTNPLNIFLHAFQSAYLPVYFSFRQSGNPEEGKKLEAANSHMWFFACLLFLGAVFFLPEIVILLTPEKFDSSAGLVSVLALGFLVKMYGNIFNNEIYYSKATHWIPIVTIASIASNLAVVYFTVERWGALSVAWGMTIGYMVWTIMCILVSLRLFEIPQNKTYLWFTAFYCTLSMPAQYYFSNYAQLSLGLQMAIYTLLILIFFGLSVYSFGFNPQKILKQKFRG